MSLMSKSDLIYMDYKWSAYGNDDPKITGEPDSSLFSRKEGYEVLYLINKIASDNGLKQKSSGEKLEKMIHEYLPSDTRSQVNVVKWIKANWDKY
ncbi:hypothetical protein GF376_02410 [Candidatus Peregrinibacteria bacterium]|nr:hypothetical protein [Candidatus Peregrinibacteria bacterium]